MSDIFDWPALLSRVNDNAGLAQRLLVSFFAEHQHGASLAQTALATGGPAEARRLVHRIGGSAANLGLPQVASAARTCEAMLLHGAAPQAEPWRLAVTHLQDMIASGQARVDAILAAQPADEAPAAGGAVPAGSDDAEVLAVHLTTLLAASDLSALAVAEQWRRSVASTSRTDAIIAAIRALDFAHAAALLEGKDNGFE